MSKVGKPIVVIGWVLVLASCATPDANHAATQRPQAAGAAAVVPADGGGGGAGGGY